VSFESFFISGLSSEHHELPESGLGNRGVEVLVFVEPLIGEVSVPILAHDFVNRVQIFHPANLVDKGMGGLEYWLVIVLDAQREPSLHHLGLYSIRDIQVEVNSRKNVDVHIVLILVSLKAVDEKNLLVGGPLVKALEVEGRGLAFKLDVLVSQ
jgi:hypothetical protein